MAAETVAAIIVETTWATSLWRNIISVAPKDEAQFMTAGMCFSQVVGYWFPCLILTLIWKLKLLQSLRILPKDKSPPDALVTENIIKSIFSTTVTNPVLTYFFMSKICLGNVYTDPPSFFTFVWQISVFFVLNDFYFYWAHRLVHDNTALYRQVHKLHHRFTYTVGFAASGNASIVEDLCINLISTVGPPAILAYATPVHASVYIMYLIVRWWETVEGHSGYSNPFSIWHYLRSNDFHAYHHRYYNRGNFGIFPWWDSLCGTDKYYRKDRSENNKKWWQ
jgi:sterol desaturase/sphingolipid hydroxylase (fatty acid hydroxylase superfamily)